MQSSRYIQPKRSSTLVALVAVFFAVSALRGGEDWPGLAFDTVRAYAWPAVQDLETVVQPDMSPVAGPIDPKGEMLTAAQIKQLIASVTRKRPSGRNNLIGCFQPHHVFIFYDVSGRPVAYAEVCLRYHGYRVSPDSPDLEPHYGNLASLCAELGLALPKDFSLEDYRREFDDTYVHGAGFEGAD